MAELTFRHASRILDSLKRNFCIAYYAKTKSVVEKCRNVRVCAFMLENMLCKQVIYGKHKKEDEKNECISYDAKALSRLWYDFYSCVVTICMHILLRLESFNLY